MDNSNTLCIQPDISLFYSLLGAPGLGIKPPKLDHVRVFVQSTSYGSRCLKAGTTILYKVQRFIQKYSQGGGQSKTSWDRVGASIRLVCYIWKYQGGASRFQGGAKAPSRPPPLKETLRYINEIMSMCHEQSSLGGGGGGGVVKEYQITLITIITAQCHGDSVSVHMYSFLQCTFTMAVHATVLALPFARQYIYLSAYVLLDACYMLRALLPRVRSACV